MGKFISTILMLGFCLPIWAQQQIVTAFGDVNGSGGSIGFSVGQVGFIGLTNTTNAGVQQPYDNSIALSLTGLRLTATKQGKEVMLNWETTTETNTSHFVVQRSSVVAPVFDSIGIVAAKGNSITLSKYSMPDKFPVKGTNYYRLKQVDKDGKFVYSITVAISFDGSFIVSCYPNPATSSIKLDVGVADATGYKYQVLDMSGRLVLSGTISGSITMVNLERLEAAVYTIKVTSSQHEVASINILKK